MKKLAWLYSDGKRWLSDTFGASEDLLHIHAGLLIFVIAALLFRHRMRSRVPIALVYLFAVGNEIMDIFGPSPNASRLEPWLDIFNTVFWPTILFVIARRRSRAGDVNRTA
jgi:hypothetical protein